MPQRNSISINIQHFQYGPILALKEIRTAIPFGSLTAVLGPNGGGKSSFLKAIAGVERFKGSITGSNHKRLAYLAQHSSFDRTFPMRVEDVVAMGLWGKRKSFYRLPSDTTLKIDAALEKVNLRDFRKRSLHQLSGGQLQRILFARILIQDADIILLDEPFAGIDGKTVRDLMSLVHEWHEQGKTLLVVLHDLCMIREHFPQAILLSQRLVAHGDTQEILTLENLAKVALGV